MFAMANYKLYGSYQKASGQTGIPESTLKQRVTFLKRDFKDCYVDLEKMKPKELNEQVKMYSE